MSLLLANQMQGNGIGWGYLPSAGEKFHTDIKYCICNSKPPIPSHFEYFHGNNSEGIEDLGKYSIYGHYYAAH